MSDEIPAPVPKPVDKPAAEKAEAGKSFWLVLITDAADEVPQCTRCETAAALTSAIQDRVLGAKAPLYAFAFEGRRIDISAPRPICSFKLGDAKIDVGRDGDEYDEGGRIVPLARPEAG